MPRIRFTEETWPQSAGEFRQMLQKAWENLAPQPPILDDLPAREDALGFQPYADALAILAGRKA